MAKRMAPFAEGGSAAILPLDRRLVLASALALLTGLPGCAQVNEQARLLMTLGEIVIPTTDTPGAGNRDVADFVIRAVDRGVVGAKPEALAQLAAILDQRSARPFLQLPPHEQITIVNDLDRVSYAPKAPASPWKQIKAIIIIGYYTSQVGATMELNFEPLPGRFDADIQIGPSFRAMQYDGLDKMRI